MMLSRGRGTALPDGSAGVASGIKLPVLRLYLKEMTQCATNYMIVCFRFTALLMVVGLGLLKSNYKFSLDMITSFMVRCLQEGQRW